MWLKAEKRLDPVSVWVRLEMRLNRTVGAGWVHLELSERRLR